MSTRSSMWMVRAGERGWRFDEFERQSIVSIGWVEMGDLSPLKSREDFLRQTAEAYPTDTRFRRANSAGQVYRFVREMRVNDDVITYSPEERVFLVGTVAGDYEFRPADSPEQPNVRRVVWRGRVARDGLSVGARNSLGAISTLFLVPPDVASELLQALDAPAATAGTAAPTVPAAEQVEDLYKDIQNRAFEFTKDRVNQLGWDQMQELVAGLLRAMGYKTRISPSGSDRGKDIVASPDGLGLEDPRIVVEVKHRTAAMGSQELRSFLGGRHDKDKGLYVSTGGFTRDARYEAERARIPVTLMDLDDLVSAVIEHYEHLDMETQRLVALRKLYWPA